MRTPAEYHAEFKRNLRALEATVSAGEVSQKQKFCWLAINEETVPLELRSWDNLHRFVFTHSVDFRDSHINTAYLFARQSHNFVRFCFCSKMLVETGCLGSGTGVHAYVAPLYTIHIGNEDCRFAGLKYDYDCVRENLTPGFRQWINDVYQEYFTVKEITGYCYSVLHNRAFLDLYYEFLKLDFPKIPFVKDIDAFRRLSELGCCLMELHLLNNYPLDAYRLQRNESMPALPDGLRFCYRPRGYLDREKCRLEIANGWYIPHVIPEVYDYVIGNYKVLQKWLKYRKNDEITLPVYLHILDMLYAIEGSLALELEINKFNIPAMPAYRAGKYQETQPPSPSNPLAHTDDNPPRPSALNNLFDF